MPSFGKASLERLSTCHPDLQAICHEAIKLIDFTVVCGHRNEVEQNLAYNTKKSQLKFPASKHNKTPSLAVDIAPYPINWADKNRFHYLAGIMKGIALSKGIKLRWGGDWDNNGELNDQVLIDLPHFEI